MINRLFVPVLWLLAGALCAHAQNDPLVARVAGLEQDVTALRREVGQLRLELEAALRENRRLREELARREAEEAAAPAQPVVTTAMLNAALNEVRREWQQVERGARQELLNELTTRLESLLGQQTPAPVQPAEQPAVAFSDDYPKSGVTHVVEPGDTLSGLARRYGSTVAYIRNANKLADESRILVGQKLFIPQEKP